MDKEITDILESYGINVKPRINELSLRSFIVDCPTCNAKSRFSFDPDDFKGKSSDTGIFNVLLELPCSHVFLAHVDREFKIRGTVRIETGIHFSVDRIDMRYLKEQESALEKLHLKLASGGGNANIQYKVFKELERIRKAMNGIK